MAGGRLLLACFFLSGATGLVYEVAWTRSLTLVFGTTTFAVSTILAAFMAGLGAGAAAVGRFVDRGGRPLRVYAWLELGIGTFALAFPHVPPLLVPVYRALWEGQHASFVAMSLVRFAILFVLLLVPTMLMGGTLPALARHFETGERAAGRAAGLLYGINTLGAVAGAGAAGFMLLPWLGLRHTTTVAAAVNLTIGAGALVLSLREAGPAAPVSAPQRRDRRLRPPEAGLLAVFALSGFVALLSEVAWTRGLTLVLGSSTYAFTIMLVTFLAGLGGGSLGMVRLLGRGPDLLRALALLQAGIGLLSMAAAHLFAELPLLYLYLFKAVSGAAAPMVVGQFALAGLIMLGPALLMGAMFPIVVELLGDRHAGERVGLAYASNTLGAVLGAALAGFVIMPAIGIAHTLILGVALSLAAALGVLAVSGRHWRGASVTAALLVSLPLLAPRWEPLAMSSGVYKEAPLFLRLYASPPEVFTRLLPQFSLLYYRDGPTATVTVTERPSLEDHRHLALAIDGKVDASTSGDMPTQVLSGHLPLLLHPDPETVLVIGLASGVTVGAVARHPVREITAVEIEPAVVEASGLFAAVNHQPLRDPRVRLVVDDARNLLLRSPARYDVIISEPSNPWMSGPAKLFTYEFFQLGRQRLRPHGLFVQWLQLYGITEEALKTLVRTFRRVFPHHLVFQPAEGDLLLVGGAEPVLAPPKRIGERMGRNGIAEDLARVGVRDVFDLLARFRLGEAETGTWAGAGPLNTDDNALIEFSAPWQIHLETLARNTEAVARAGERVAPYLALDDSSSRERAEFLVRLAAKVLALGDATRAETIAGEGLALATSADGLSVLGAALERQGRDQEAVRLWQEALTLAPRHRDTLLRLALYHHERGEPAEAAQRLSPLADAGDPDVRYLLGVSHYERRLYRGALAFLEDAASGGRQRPMDGAESVAGAWAGGLGVRRLALYYLHVVNERLGHRRAAAQAWARFLGALDDWREELERKRPDPGRFALVELVRRRSERGVGRPEDAHLTEVLVRRVVEPLSHYYQGVTAYILGYPEHAIADLNVALSRLGPAGRRSRALLYLGLAEWRLEHLPSARLHLEGFLEHLEGPDRNSLAAAEASRALASIYAAQGMPERAAELGRRAELILKTVEGR